MRSVRNNAPHFLLGSVHGWFAATRNICCRILHDYTVAMYSLVMHKLTLQCVPLHKTKISCNIYLYTLQQFEFQASATLIFQMIHRT